MSEAIVAKRYAEALFQLGEEKDTLEQLSDELRMVKEVFLENKNIITVLKHPRINDEKKKQFVNKTFQGLQTDVVNMIHLLVERHRVEITPSIIDHFIQFVNDARGIAEVTVRSVRELTEAEKTELKSGFAKRFNKKAIELTNIVDPKIIGGLRIQIGNTIYDGTISGKLNRIEQNITSANK